jgi:adenylate cyclase
MSRVCPRCSTPIAQDQARCAVCDGAPARPSPLAPGGLRGPRLSGELDGKRTDFPLGLKTTLGRHPANTIRLADREVSKDHAAIERSGADFILKDLDSSNGTFVNGRRIKELKLREGDEIALGGSTLTFHQGSPAQGASAPGVTVVASAVPAILASISQQVEEAEFRPAEQVADVAALRQDYDKLRIAHEFHRQIGLERDRASLFDKILKLAFQLLAADHGVLFLAGPEGELQPAAVRHRKEEDVEVVLSDTLLRRVAETRQAVLTADAIIDSRFSGSESIVAQGIRSAMAVPLLAEGQLKGVLFLDSRERAHAFSEKDLRILSGVASQAAIALQNAELAQRIEHEAITRAELSRFLSPKVAEMVVSGKVELLRQGRLAEVTVLFADIRGFTSISEKRDPQETVSMLNRFFTAMAQVVFRHEGNLDKFIGDCVMAVWGPPSAHPDDPGRALRAALEMQRAVDRINQEREADGDPPIAVGIGLNTGQAVVGYMGSADRHEFTAIGDSVNVASRLCGVARGGEIIAAEQTVRRAGRGFRYEALPATHLKGKEKGTSALRILGIEDSLAGTT